MKKFLSFLLSSSMILTMGTSAFAGGVSDSDAVTGKAPVIQSEEVIEPQGLACRYCGGRTITLPPDYGRWVNSYTEGCPDGKMGCLHMIQERNVAYYYSCTECGRTTSTSHTEYQDLGHFSGTRR